MKTAGEINNKKLEDLVCVNKNSSLSNAIKMMNEKNVGAILVKDGNDIVGIWTERDLLKHVLDINFDIKNGKIEDYMTKDLIFVESNSTTYQLMDVILGARIRHILIKDGEKFIGMLSSGDIIKTVILERDLELRDLKDSVNWQYYENWKRR
jgi:CBS domain-containing protein